MPPSWLITPPRWKKSSRLSPFEQIDFKSGARLLLQRDARLPKVHLRCVLRAGPLYEPENQRGISALLAELLTKDTAARSAPAIAELIESIGGSFSATGGNNTISLALEVLPADLGIALELLQQSLDLPGISIERPSKPSARHKSPN